MVVRYFYLFIHCFVYSVHDLHPYRMCEINHMWVYKVILLELRQEEWKYSGIMEIIPSIYTFQLEFSFVSLWMVQWQSLQCKPNLDNLNHENFWRYLGHCVPYKNLNILLWICVIWSEWKKLEPIRFTSFKANHIN